MPRKAKHPCGHPGCPNLTEERYCSEHKPLHPDRPSAAKRGYGSKWQRVSKAYLRKHPLCVKCQAQGRYDAYGDGVIVGSEIKQGGLHIIEVQFDNGNKNQFQLDVVVRAGLMHLA